MSVNNQHLNKTDLILKFAFYFLILLTAAMFIYGINMLVIPIVISLINYYLFSSLVDYFESIGVKRVYTITVMFLVISLVVFFIVYIFIPPLVSQLHPLLTEWTNSSDENRFKFLNLNIAIKINERGLNWNEIIKPADLVQKMVYYLKDTVKAIIAFIPNLITYALITPVISFIFLLNLDKFKKSLIEFIPNRFFEMTLMITWQIDKQITNYFKSLAIQAGIMSSIVAIGLLMIGFIYPFVLAIIVGMANSIPYLGPIIGAIPLVLICLLNPEYSSMLPFVIGIILFAQIIDNILVQPAFIAKSVSLNPVFLIGGVVVAGNLFGIAGMLFAVPFMSILKVTMEILYRSLRKYKII